MKKIIFTIALIIFYLQLQAQTVIVYDKKDTTICFTIEQSKFILKEHYQLKECDTLRIVCEKQNAIHDSINAKNDSIINSERKISLNKDTIISNNEFEIKVLLHSNKILCDEVQKQKKIKKVIIWACSVVLGAVVVKNFVF